MSMTKEEKQAFLERGGILMRAGVDKNGEPCMKWRTWKYDYQAGFVSISCGTVERVQRQMDLLATRHPDKFQIDQDN
jgi:hypothetical protein